MPKIGTAKNLYTLPMSGLPPNRPENAMSNPLTPAAVNLKIPLNTKALSDARNGGLRSGVLSVICLAENRLVASLKKMADFLVLSVVVLAVAGKHSLHNAANRIILHLDQQMHVVWHEAVGVKIEG